MEWEQRAEAGVFPEIKIIEILLGHNTEYGEFLFFLPSQDRESIHGLKQGSSVTSSFLEISLWSLNGR